MEVMVNKCRIIKLLGFLCKIEVTALMHHIKRLTVGSIILFLLSGLVYYLSYSYVAAAIPEPYTDPHGDYQSDTPKCAKCHSGHTAPAQGVARGSTQRETCYACHDGSNASPDIRNQFGEDTIGSSVYSGTGSFHPVPTEVQLCTNCHDPHLASDAAPEGKASLLSVGPSNISSGNAVCGHCHGSGSTAPGGDMFTTFTGTAHDVIMTNPPSGTQISVHAATSHMLLQSICC
jgi:predicted CXXCH cytochrome family protein